MPPRPARAPTTIRIRSDRAGTLPRPHRARRRVGRGRCRARLSRSCWMSIAARPPPPRWLRSARTLAPRRRARRRESSGRSRAPDFRSPQRSSGLRRSSGVAAVNSPASMWLLRQEAERELQVHECARVASDLHLASGEEMQGLVVPHLERDDVAVSGCWRARASRPTSSLETSIASRSSRARASVGAAAAYPSVKRIANASSSTSTVRGGAAPVGAARAAAATAGAPPTTSTSLDMAPPSASRYVSRASSGSSGSRRLAALRNRRPASPPRRCSNAIWRAQKVDPGAPELVEHTGLDACQQPERSLQIAGIALRAGGREQALRAVRGLGCERGGALEEGSDGRQSAARLRPSGGTLELCGDVLVGHRCRLRPVPRAAIRVDLADRLPPPGRGGQRGAPSARLPDRRPSEPVDDGKPLGHQAPSRSSASTVSATDSGIPSCCGRPPNERRVADRIGRRHEQQAPRVAREAWPAAA